MNSAADFWAISPIIAATAAAIAVMLAIAVRRNHAATAILTTVGLTATLFTTLLAAGQSLPRQVTPLIRMDYYSLFFTAVICLAAIGVAAPSYGYLKNLYSSGRSEDPVPFRLEEYYLLLLVSTLGAVILVSSTHFASFFLGLELLSVPMLAMIAYPVNHNLAVEAGVKYLVLTALASGLLLFGMALIYAQSGTMFFDLLAYQLTAAGLGSSAYFIAGVMLILAGVGFKLSLVPFHMWTPDVYQGAATPVSAYVATVSKAAIFAVLMRYFFETGAAQNAPVIAALSALAIASMLVGNWLALLQTDVKRVLAYSSIAHVGYLLVALLAGEVLGMEAAAFFLVAYIVTNLGAFGTVALLEAKYANYRSGDLSQYRGLFWRHPVLAGTFTLMLLSLAGIPLTVGFIGKFYIFAAGVEHTRWLLVAGVVVGSALGLFYYLRIVVFMFSAPAAVPEGAPVSRLLSSGVTLIVLTAMLFWLGVYPAPLISLIQNMVFSMVL